MSVVLGVNLDHIATLRQVRGASYPQPVEGARVCEACGVNGVTLHLREDRRHIQDYDVFNVKEVLSTCILNLEMALNDDVIAVARKIVPHMVTLVPERREELTTEGGLDVVRHAAAIKKLTEEFRQKGILVSLFIEPDEHAVSLSKEVGADYIELHTGSYADAADAEKSRRELDRLFASAECAVSLGLKVNAGHGLNYDNIAPVLSMKGLCEVNIGHSIISRAVFTGLKTAILDMKSLLEKGGK